MTSCNSIHTLLRRIAPQNLDVIDSWPDAAKLYTPNPLMSIFLVFSFASQAGLTLPGPFWDLALIFIRSTGLDMYGSLHPALDRIMHIQPYLPGVTTRQLDTEACVGCGMCESVCPHTPHTVFQMKGKKAAIEDLDGCMECGACAQN